MTQQEIFDYNKRCAEFLTISEEIENELVAYPKQQYSPLCSYANAAYITDKEDNPDNTVWNYCKFHSDWNWIIEVVEAIENIDDTTKHYQWEDLDGKTRSNFIGYSVEIDKNRCSIWLNLELDPPECIFLSKTTNKKEAVVQAINQFLIWYNEQVQTNQQTNR